MQQFTPEKETIIVPLSIFVPGAGHIYIGKRRRGISFLILAVAASTFPFAFPFPFGIITLYVPVAIWISQFLDIMKITKTQRSHNN